MRRRRRRGQARPGRKPRLGANRARVTIDLPRTLHDSLVKISGASGEPVSEVIRRAIGQYVEGVSRERRDIDERHQALDDQAAKKLWAYLGEETHPTRDELRGVALAGSPELIDSAGEESNAATRKQRRKNGNND